jgi:hypothetical protein
LRGFSVLNKEDKKRKVIEIKMDKHSYFSWCLRKALTLGMVYNEISRAAKVANAPPKK